MPKLPEWWDWELRLSEHVLLRMADRDFNELDLRYMFWAARRVRRDVKPGRWIVETRFHGRPWEIVVEPDANAQVVVAITAYDASS